MDMKDFRIGNYLEYNYPMDGWGNHQVILEDIEDLENGDFRPLPISKEWLLVLNFLPFNGSEDKYSLMAWHNKEPKTRFDFDFYINDNMFFFKSRYQGDQELQKLPHIKNIHQLQNLYFLLTNKELYIKS